MSLHLHRKSNHLYRNLGDAPLQLSNPSVEVVSRKHDQKFVLAVSSCPKQFHVTASEAAYHGVGIISEDDTFTVYQPVLSDDDSRLFVRPTDEFRDGRFEKVGFNIPTKFDKIKRLCENRIKSAQANYDSASHNGSYQGQVISKDRIEIYTEILNILEGTDGTAPK